MFFSKWSSWARPSSLIKSCRRIREVHGGAVQAVLDSIHFPDAFNTYRKKRSDAPCFMISYLTYTQLHNIHRSTSCRSSPAFCPARSSSTFQNAQGPEAFTLPRMEDRGGWTQTPPAPRQLRQAYETTWSTIDQPRFGQEVQFQKCQ